MQYFDAMRRRGEQLIAALARLCEDEGGASMTEFIITLPVFLLIFQGILTLGELQRRSVGVKIEASHDMWDEAINIQTSAYGAGLRHLDPTAAGFDAASQVTRGSNTSMADYLASAKQGALGLHGHYGESNSLLGVPTVLASSIPDTHHEAQAHLDQQDEEFAVEHVDDGRAPALPTSPSELNSLTSGLGATSLANGPRQALGAGIRYGIALGEGGGTFRVPLAGQQDMLESYDTLAAPRSMTRGEEVLSVAISRVGAETRCTFSEVLGIAFNQPLTGC